MTTEVELLPLYAELQGHPKIEIIKHYARANVARAIAAKDAEIDALRTRLEDTVRDSTNKIESLRKLLDRMVVCNPDGSVGIRVTEDALNAAAELYRLFGDVKKEAGND